MHIGNNGESVFVDKTVVNTKISDSPVAVRYFCYEEIVRMYPHPLCERRLRFEEMAINFLRIIEIRTSMDRSETS